MAWTITEATRAFLAFKREERRDAETLAQYEGHLDRWQTWRKERGCSPLMTEVTEDEVARFFRYLTMEAIVDRGSRRGQRGYAPGTIRGYHRTLSTFWRWARRQKLHGSYRLPATAAFLFERGSIALPSSTERERPAIARAQFDALLAATGDGSDEESARNRAILWLLWDSGARVHEVAELDSAKVDLSRRRAEILGKGQNGGKPGTIFWTAEANLALRRYLLLRRGPATGPMFRGVNSRNQGEACTTNLIRCMLKRLAKRAGVQLPQGSPCHAFRHAFARRMRAAGLSKREVGELLRDETPAVIDRYLGLDVEPRQRLYDRATGQDGQTLRRARDA